MFEGKSAEVLESEKQDAEKELDKESKPDKPDTGKTPPEKKKRAF